VGEPTPLPLLKPFSNIEAIILKLWEKALLPNEKNIIKPIQELNDFIQKEIIKCNNIADAMEESAVRTDMLDAFFRMVIQTYNGDY
jgi:hypothetical protein